VPLTLADAIEAYLLDLVREAEKALEISRREVSQRFRCAPSQINYVLETRFTPERGFLVHSRRGGGGGIFITRVSFDGRSQVLQEMYRQAARGLTSIQALHLTRLLLGRAVVSPGEGRLMETVLGTTYVAGPGDADCLLRGRIMQSMLRALMS
jgi:transcriptional regulator CtsR